MMAVADAQDALGTPEEVHATESSPEEGQEPSLILGKFKDQEALVKAYSELESKLGQTEEPKTEPELAQEEEAPQQTAEELVTEKGLDYSKFEAEVAQNGQLGLESLALLNEAGISSEAAQTYVSNVLSQQQSIDQELDNIAFEVAGSEESYTTLLSWADDNLDNSHKEAFNYAEASKNPALYRQALQALMFQKEQSFGNDPDVRIGGRTSRPTQDGLNSRGSIIAAMSDPKYFTDSSYRREVEQKLINGDQFL